MPALHNDYLCRDARRLVKASVGHVVELTDGLDDTSSAVIDISDARCATEVRKRRTAFLAARYFGPPLMGARLRGESAHAHVHLLTRFLLAVRSR